MFGLGLEPELWSPLPLGAQPSTLQLYSPTAQTLQAQVHWYRHALGLYCSVNVTCVTGSKPIWIAESLSLVMILVQPCHSNGATCNVWKPIWTATRFARRAEIWFRASVPCELCACEAAQEKFKCHPADWQSAAQVGFLFLLGVHVHTCFGAQKNYSAHGLKRLEGTLFRTSSD